MRVGRSGFIHFVYTARLIAVDAWVARCPKPPGDVPQQSVSSTLNDPTIDGDQEGWWDYVESWVASDATAPVPTTNHEVPDVTVGDFSSYMQRMAPYRTFFAENALELLEQEKDGEVGWHFATCPRQPIGLTRYPFL